MHLIYYIIIVILIVLIISYIIYIRRDRITNTNSFYIKNNNDVYKFIKNSCIKNDDVFPKLNKEYNTLLPEVNEGNTLLPEVNEGNTLLPEVNEGNYNIPNNLHFIWIGSQIPDKYLNNIKTYIDNNPTYNIYLWTDKTNPENINKFNSKIICKNVDNDIKIINKQIYDEITIWAGKADILRYEIIYSYGGIYLDVDSISKKPFDGNFKSNFVCIEVEYYKNISNAQFGMNKNDKFLKYVIECLAKNYNSNNKDNILIICGPPFFTTCFYHYRDKNIKLINQKFVIHNTPESYNYHTNDKNW